MARTYHTFDCVIVGSGSAAVAALQEALKYSSNVMLVAQEKTLSALSAERTAVMAFTHAAQMFHQRHEMADAGIDGTHHLRPVIADILAAARRKQELLLTQAQDELAAVRSYITYGTVEIESDKTLRIDGRLIHTKTIIAETHAACTVPDAIKPFEERFISAATLLEQQDIPRRIGVIGMGSTGLEIAQALAMLQCEVTAVHPETLIGGITDTTINKRMSEAIADMMTLWTEAAIRVEQAGNGALLLAHGSEKKEVDALFVATPRTTDAADKKFRKLNLPQGNMGLPCFIQHTMQVPGTSLFLAGDTTDERSSLHYSIDEGRRAARGALNGSHRHGPLMAAMHIVMTEPRVVVVGRSHHQLRHTNCLTGHADFGRLPQAVVEQRTCGKVCLYADRKDGELLGAELMAPDGEHMAHLLVLAISQGLTARQILKMPFYHPSLEEGLKVALEDIVRQL